MGNKEEIDKLFMKMEIFSLQKIPSTEFKVNPQEKIFIIHKSDKELISRIYRQLLIFSNNNNKTQNNPIQKWAMQLNRYFSKEDTQMANTQEKIPKEIQVKGTVRSHLTPIKIATTKKRKSNCWQGWRGNGTPTLCC